MKRLITFALMTICLFVSCSKFDDSEIWDKLNDHESRIAYLEEVCKKMNTDITNLQTIVTALESNDYIVTASPLASGDGYTFIFKSGKSVVIYNGKDGIDGADGKDGKDGVTPIISVMKDVDGVYYWTVNNEWLLVNGEKVRASAFDGVDGEDGKDGVNGEDGITPKFKIEDDYWFVSYDNGKSWEELGKASGSNGLDGDDGDSFFKGVSISDGFVQFVLNDENGTVIKVPYLTDDTLVFVSEKPGDVKVKLTNQQKRSVVHLAIEGYVDDADIRYIADQMLALEILDLRKSNLISVPEYAFCKGEVKYGKETIRKIYLPDCCSSVGNCAFYGCTNLEYIEAKGDVRFSSNCFSYCDNVSLRIGSSTFVGDTGYPKTNIDTLILCGATISNIEELIVNHVVIESTVKSIEAKETGLFEDLYISSIEFEEPSSIQTLNIGIFSSSYLEEITFPTEVMEIKYPDMYSLAYAYSLKRIVVPEESKLSQWQLYPSHMKYVEEIYCYKSIPPTLTWFGSDRVSPIVYVPIENYSAYANAPIWKTFTIKTIM